jgi:hypothetical protein
MSGVEDADVVLATIGGAVAEFIGRRVAGG